MRNFKTFFLLIFLFLPLSFILAQSTIEVGSFLLHSGMANYTLDKGSGERFQMIEIRFSNDFSSKPEILFSIDMLDCSKESNLRYAVESSFLSKEGFVLKVRTWADTKIYHISGKWMAILTE